MLGLYYKNSVNKENIMPAATASLASHIPNKCEQMVRCNGYYSNVCRGRRKKDSIDGSDCVLQDDEYTKGTNKSWARLIKKIYEVDPLICPIWGAPHMVELYIMSQMRERYEDY